MKEFKSKARSGNIRNKLHDRIFMDKIRTTYHCGFVSSLGLPGQIWKPGIQKKYRKRGFNGRNKWMWQEIVKDARSIEKERKCEDYPAPKGKICNSANESIADCVFLPFLK
jgi:hypothetical protein